MDTCYVGIDIGFTGGIAALLDGKAQLCPMPTVQYDVVRKRSGVAKPGKDTELDTAAIVRLFNSLKEKFSTLFVMIEKPTLRPGQGVVSQAKFFGQFTEFRGILVSLKIPFEHVHPATWKADVWRGQQRPLEGDDENGKEQARLKAIQMFPEAAEMLAKKNTHGMAEALLIADYAKRRHNG